MYADILVPPLQEPLTYSVPGSLISSISVGQCVKIPVGRARRWGYVIALHPTLPARCHGLTIKELEVIDAAGVHVTPTMIPLLEWVAYYYGYPLAQVIESIVPPSVPQFPSPPILEPPFPPTGFPSI